MFPFATQSPEQMFHAGQAALQAGDLARARNLFEAVLKQVPNEPATRYHLGVTLIREGDPKSALPHFEKALALVPGNAEFWRAAVETMARAGLRKQAQRLVKRAKSARLPAVLVEELGQMAARDHSAGSSDLGGAPQAEVDAVTAALGRGALGEARKRAAGLVTAHPQSAFARNLAGVVSAQAGETAEAQALFDAAIALDPYFPEPAANLGRMLLEDGDAAAARTVFETALANAPRHAGCRLGLARALAALGRLDAGLDAVNSLLTDFPDDADARRLAGQLLLALNRHREAADAFATLAAPTAEDRLNLARAQAGCGEETGAQAVLEGLVSEAVLAPAPRLELASLLASRGDFAGARAVYDALLGSDPGCAAAYEGAGRIGRWTAGDPLIAAMADRLADPETTGDDRAVIGFALAKAYEDTGDDARVMPVLDAANAAVRAGFDYAPDQLQAETDALVELFSGETIDRILGFGGVRDDLPIFVTGMPRSGSTLVEQIIARHPDVASAGELGAFVGPAAALLQDDDGALVAPDRLTPAAIARLGRDCLAALHARAGGKARITDKMLNGFAHAPLIAAALPQAHIVHVSRDPADNCLSIYKNRFEPGQYPFAYDQAEVALAYVQYARVIAAWEARMPGRIIHVGYDALVADPEAESRRLLSALGLDWSADCLDPARGPRTIRTLSVYQARQEVHARSSHAWTRFEGGLAPMLEVLKRAGLMGG